MSVTSVAQALNIRSIRHLWIELAVMALALAMALLYAVTITEDEPAGIEPASLLETGLLLTPAILVLLFRRRWPLLVLTAATMLIVIIRLRSVPELQISSLAFIVALFAAGRHGREDWRNSLRALAIAVLLGHLAYDAWSNWDNVATFNITRRFYVLSLIGNVIANITTFAITWWAGDQSRRRAHRERDLAARTLELEASREENAQRAVMDERVRIAREIHDVVAHHVSVMGLQAGAARRLAHKPGADIEEPLRAIEDSSRAAVTELHRLLGFLRRDDEIDPDGLSPEAMDPSPGLHRLPELRTQVASAGLALDLEIEGDERSLPASVDLNAYRILQEALTNCLKYAGTDVAEVTISYADDALTLHVADRGLGLRPTTRPSGSGSGLRGMAERVSLVGGSLRHGARPGGGFEVEAVLPYSASATAARGTQPVETPA